MDVGFTSEKLGWIFIGGGCWRQKNDGLIYPPVWSMPTFDPDPDQIPNAYAHDLAQEDFAFLSAQRFGDVDVAVDFKCPYGSVLHGGIVLRAQDSTCFYVLEIVDIFAKRECAYEFSLWRQGSSGIRTLLARGIAPHSVVPQRIAERGAKTRQEWDNSSPDWIRARVQASGTYLRVSADGRTLYELRDRTHSTGFVGLMARGAVYFRNLQIEGSEVEDGPPWPRTHADRRQYFYPGGRQPEGFNAYPAMGATADSAIAVAWAHRGLNDASHVAHRILLTISHDEGQTWDIPVCIFDSDGPKCIPTALFGHQDGSLSCHVHVWPSDGQEAQSLVVHSQGGTSEWSAKPFLGGGHLKGNQGLCSPAVKLSNGDVLVCGYEFQTFPGGDPDHYSDREDRTLLFRSSNDGHSWSSPAFIHSPEFGNVDCRIVETQPGELIAFMASQHRPGTYRSLSHDNGLSWSAREWIDLPADCPYLLRHSSGTLILIRRGMGVFAHVSHDEGRTWSHPYRLSPASGIAALLELPNGRILAVYHEGYKVPGHIRGQYFDLPLQ